MTIHFEPFLLPHRLDGKLATELPIEPLEPTSLGQISSANSTTSLQPAR